MKLLKKVTATVLSLALVFNSVTLLNVKADGEVSIQNMVKNSKYNLALSKVITANPSLQEGSEAALSDGLFNAHAATTFGKTNTYYLIDLGKTYDASTLDKLVVGYKEKNDGDTPINGYKIQYSSDGYYYRDVLSIKGTAVKSQITDTNLIEQEDISSVEGKVRFIKILYPNVYNWGIQANEIAVLDTDQNATEMEVDKCDNAKAVSLKSDDYNSLTYNITPDENQDDYKYMVYLDGKKIIGNGVDASKDITVEDVPEGNHTVTVVSVQPDKLSLGIESERVFVNDITSLVKSKANVACNLNNRDAKVTAVSKYYEGHNSANASKIIDGVLKPGEGTGECLRLDKGSNQFFVIDLGKYYKAEELSEILIGYANGDTGASDVKVDISMDGINYTEVAKSTGYKYKEKSSTSVDLNRVPVTKVSSYPNDSFRFVKITVNKTGNQWGYCVVETSIVMNSNNPTEVVADVDEVASVDAKGEGFGKAKFTITPSENQDDSYKYIVLVNGKIVNTNANPNEEYVLENLPTGLNEIVVESVSNNWVSKGKKVEILVDGYENYITTGVNFAYNKINYGVKVTCEKANWTGKSGEGKVQGSQGISAAPEVVVNGTVDDYGHHSGYIQGMPGEKVVDIDIDLDKEYDPNDIKAIISYYENADRAAKEYEILFSGDNVNYERVFYTNKYEFKKALVDMVDVSKYSQEKVRYVRYKLLDGNYGNPFKEDGVSINYGSDSYHICEIAVMGSETMIPKAPVITEATSNGYNNIEIEWDKGTDENVTFSVYIDGYVKQSDISYEDAGHISFNNIRGGNHRIEIYAKAFNIATKSESVYVQVEAEPTTARPTQKPTVKPTANPTTTKFEEPKTDSPEIQSSQDNNTSNSNLVAKIKKVTVKKKKISLKLSAVKGAKKYQIQYSLKKNFKKAVKKNTSKLSYTIKKLKSKKRYYIRVRALVSINNKLVFTKWSKIKRTKKVK